MPNFEKTMQIIAQEQERAKTDLIELDTPFAKEIGFTSDRFEGYLWREDNFITISCIMSKQPLKGNLTQLFKAINSKGFKIQVPTPFPAMELILKCHGFKKTKLNDPLMGWVDLWQQQGIIWTRDYIAIKKILRKARRSSLANESTRRNNHDRERTA
jgi:hypothetical protein